MKKTIMLGWLLIASTIFPAGLAYGFEVTRGCDNVSRWDEIAYCKSSKLQQMRAEIRRLFEERAKARESGDSAKDMLSWSSGLLNHCNDVECLIEEHAEMIASTKHERAGDYPAYIESMRDMQVLEIGEVVKKFMPDAGQTYSWGHLANDPNILWMAKSVDVSSREGREDISTRFGLLRASSSGGVATYLQDKEYELPWTVQMNGGMAKFGVDSVELYPGASDLERPWPGGCFGMGFRNCEFDPLPSMLKAGVSAEEVCSLELSGTDYKIAYSLAAKGKSPVYAVYRSSGGSGGVSQAFEIFLPGSRSGLCDGFNAEAHDVEQKFFLNGEVVKADVVGAIELWRKAEKQGSACAKTQSREACEAFVSLVDRARKQSDYTVSTIKSNIQLKYPSFSNDVRDLDEAAARVEAMTRSAMIKLTDQLEAEQKRPFGEWFSIIDDAYSLTGNTSGGLTMAMHAGQDDVIVISPLSREKNYCITMAERMDTEFSYVGVYKINGTRVKFGAACYNGHLSEMPSTDEGRAFLLDQVKNKKTVEIDRGRNELYRFNAEGFDQVQKKLKELGNAL